MKRLLLQFCILLLPFIFLGSHNTFAAEQAAELTAGCVFTTSQNSSDVWALKDGNRTTRYCSSGETDIKLTNEQPFKSLYIIWDTPPQPWTLAAEQGSLPFGSYGFIHEFIELQSPQNTVTLTVNNDKNTICDIYVFAEGELPAWVQRWQPPYQDADMLLLPTHADDEHLFFGGTMPYYAGEKGLKVQVAYLTNHWAEPYRPHELLDGLWEVGITAYPVISGFADRYAGSLEQAQRLYKQEDVMAYQVEQLRRFKPEVVVGHDVNGEYGHGVHIYNTFTLQKALELSNDPTQYPGSAQQFGVWDVPKTYLHLYDKNTMLMDWNIPLKHFGGKSAIEMAKQGFAKHVSQQKYFTVEDYGPYDCRKFGLYRTTVGPDVIGGDFFENICFEVPESPPVSVEEQLEIKKPETTPAAKEIQENADDKIIGKPSAWVATLSCLAVGLTTGVAIVLAYRKSRKPKH